jgi:hypothetical protein
LTSRDGLAENPAAQTDSERCFARRAPAVDEQGEEIAFHAMAMRRTYRRLLP